MKRLLCCFAFSLLVSALHAQVTSCATYMKAQAPSDVVIPFRLADEGEETPIEWGLDLAWHSEDNIRTSVFYAGKDIIDIMRLSYQPRDEVSSGLSDDQITDLDSRISITKTWVGANVGYNINDDHDGGGVLTSWYNVANATTRAERWAKVIDLSIDYYKSKGLTNCVSISPFNEPDYGWDQGYSSSTRQSDFLNICKQLREADDYKDKYADVRLCGGNTLNDDYAYTWWNYLKAYLDEGNTHQLAGTFDSYASFFETVRAYGHHATADELHNVMEAMVGVEYGMQTGIWWGSAEYTRSQFMKATAQSNPGQRLAYGEHRSNWTSASVYRQPTGQVQLFGGMSERQSYTTYYDFLSLDRPTWFNGQRGRNYVMYLPGGTGYQTGQSSAEVTVNVQSGADIMPEINGAYKIVNVNSGYIIGFASAPSTSWTQLTQRKGGGTYKFLQWNVTPLQESGDFSYYSISSVYNSNLLLDILNWDYTAGASVGSYPGSLGTNEQWYLEYAGEGAFYIRSRYSTKCLAVDGGKTIVGANIVMAEYDEGNAAQQWRFVETSVTPNQVAPAAPTNLEAEPLVAGVRLTWEAPADKDIMCYAVLRDGNVLAKTDVTDFVDNETEPDSAYTYAVYAIDKSHNYSELSNEVTRVAVNGEQGLVAHLTFDGTLADLTSNGNHAALYGDTVYASRNSQNGLYLDGTTNYIQLPFTVASHEALTVSLWAYSSNSSSTTWQRLFDFGNGTNQYIFLTANSGSGLRLAMKNGGDEETLDAGAKLKTVGWTHVAVTIEPGKASIYVGGELAATSESITISPLDIRPALNYIGRSQFASDPLFKGYIHDVQIYNYALSSDEIADVCTAIEPTTKLGEAHSGKAYDLSGRRVGEGARGVVIENGQKVVR